MILEKYFTVKQTKHKIQNCVDEINIYLYKLGHFVLISS